MKRGKSKYYSGAFQHTYRPTKDFGVLFYRIEDRLMMFTIQSVMSRKHNIHIVAASYMFTHLHEGILPADKCQMDAYERDCMNVFVTNHNEDTGRTGPLFLSPYGFSSKVTNKDQRHSVLYILNNHVEKKLCKSVSESRWDFLAYYNNPNPFSEPLIKRNASYYLREACSIVDHEFKAGRYLKAAMIRRMMGKIYRTAEREQLIDYIITKYMFIDFEYGINLFGTYDELVKAADIVTGHEYETGEVYSRQPDLPYIEMIKLAEKAGLLGADMKIYHLTQAEMTGYANKFRRMTTATEHQIKAFFHIIPAEKRSEQLPHQ